MSNHLDNGTVLPHGLLGVDTNAEMAGFNKIYNNTALRVGIVIATYPVSDVNNFSKLTTEYDVLVFEQNQNTSSTPVRYKNCMSAEGLGSIADYFEKTLRHQTKKNTKGQAANTKGQDGAIVLLLCLDGVSDKAIIVGSLAHPDRKTNLKNGEPHLEGEYNGVHVVINEDGSTSLTFKGATDSSGNPSDSSQGNTTVKIEKDGSYQVDHKTVVQRFDKGGQASLSADKNITNNTQKDFIVSAQENISLTATKDFSVNCNKLIAQAQGSASLACQSLDVQSQSSINLTGSLFQLEAQTLANVRAPLIVLDGLVNLGGNGGQPVLLLSTQILSIGNLGMPIIGTAISGYAIKTTAQ